MMSDMQNGVKSSTPSVKYVGHKVSKVRWKPQPSGAIESSDTFVSGSCEDEVKYQVGCALFRNTRHSYSRLYIAQ